MLITLQNARRGRTHGVKNATNDCHHFENSQKGTHWSFSYHDDNLDHNQTLLMINQLNFDCRNLSLPDQTPPESPMKTPSKQRARPHQPADASRRMPRSFIKIIIPNLPLYHHHHQGQDINDTILLSQQEQVSAKAVFFSVTFSPRNS